MQSTAVAFPDNTSKDPSTDNAGSKASPWPHTTLLRTLCVCVDGRAYAEADRLVQSPGGRIVPLEADQCRMRAAGFHTSEPLQHDRPRQPAPAKTRARAGGLEQTDPVRLVQPANTVCAEAPVWSFNDQVQLRLVTGCAHELLAPLRRPGRLG